MKKIYDNIILINNYKISREKANVNDNLYNYYLRELKEKLHLLGINYENKYDYLYERLIDLKNNLSIDADKNAFINKDYYYLLNLNVELTSQITKLEQEERQSSLALKDIDKKNRMLLALEEIIIEDNYLKDLVLPLKELVNKNELYSRFIRTQDYKKTLKSLKKQREKVTNDLEKYNANKEETNYLERVENINTAINLINRIKEIRVEDASLYEKKIREINNENKELENLFDVGLEKEISDISTKIYKTLLGRNIDFVEQDFQKENFSLSFNYRQLSIKGVFYENGVEISYDIGSHARQTIIQLCCYLAFLSFLSKHNFSLPILKTAMFDCVSQPCDEKTKSCIRHILDYFVESIDSSYNFIVTSDNLTSCGNDFYDMSTGLNPNIKAD